MGPVFCLRTEVDTAASWAAKLKRKLSTDWAGVSGLKTIFVTSRNKPIKKSSEYKF